MSNFVSTGHIQKYEWSEDEEEEITVKDDRTKLVFEIEILMELCHSRYRNKLELILNKVNA